MAKSSQIHSNAPTTVSLAHMWGEKAGDADARFLVKTHRRLDERGEAKLRGLLSAGDPHGGSA